MGELIRQQRHFLLLFVQTTPTQRKVLLNTVTKDQLKVLSQIAHNIIRGTVSLNASEKEILKRDRRTVHLLGDRKLGYKHKQNLARGKQNIIYALVKIAVTYLKPVLE